MVRLLAALSCLVLAGALATDHANNIAPYCEKYPGKRVVLVPVAGEYIDMFVNWYQTAKPFLTENEQVAVIPEDEDVMPMLEVLQAKAKFDIVPPMTEGPSFLQLIPEAPKKNFVEKRPKQILKFLQKGCSVLVIDVDSAWKRNVFLEIDQERERDLVLTPCTDNAMAHTVAEDCDVNTGFMYMQPTTRMRQFLSKWYGASNGEKRIKPAFARLLREAQNSKDKVDLALLPYALFPPGKVSKFFPNSAIVQSNFRKNHDDKVAHLKSMDLWRLTK